MIVKLLTEQHLEFLRLKGGCRGSCESTGPLKKLFHYAIFQKFFSHFSLYINGICFTIHFL